MEAEKTDTIKAALSSSIVMQVFINASTSDVVATTSMEALAMGKWLICAEHACNVFVSNFSNCLIYRSPEEFSKHLEHALKEEPPPLSTSELRYLHSHCHDVRMAHLQHLFVIVAPLPHRLGVRMSSARTWSMLSS